MACVLCVPYAAVRCPTVRGAPRMPDRFLERGRRVRTGSIVAPHSFATLHHLTGRLTLEVAATFPAWLYCSVTKNGTISSRPETRPYAVIDQSPGAAFQVARM